MKSFNDFYSFAYILVAASRRVLSAGILILLFLFLFTCTVFTQPILKIDDGILCLKTPLRNSEIPAGDENINVIYYLLNISLDYTNRSISGSSRIDFAAAANGVPEIYINLSGQLNCDSVTINGSEAVFTHSGDKVYISLPVPLNIHTRASCTIYYSGTPASTGFGSFAFGSILTHKAMWSLSEPYGSSDWWPNKNSVDDKADSADIIITCDSSFTAVSNGILLSKTVTQDKATFHWKTRYPIAQYLISVAAAPYLLYTNYFPHSAADSMPVTHYSTSDFFEARKPQFDKTIPMLELFTRLFGEYPFIKEKYGHAEFGRGGGMEHQTISSMGGFSDGLMAHELAHQWFGDKVTNKDWRHIWLHEGFATYSEGLWYESLDKSFYSEYMAIREGAAKSASGSILVRDISNVNSIFDFFRTYAKASWVPHMLRGITGDSLFFSICKTFIASPQFAYGSATTEDFEAIASSLYGKSLGKFFNQWIYQKDYPKYLISYTFTKNFDGTYTTSMLFDQSANTDGVVFEMPIQTVIRTTGGDTTLTLFNSLQMESFVIRTAAEPLSVSIDPDNWILKEVNLIRGYTSETLEKGYMIWDIYPTPTGTSAHILVELLQSQNVYIKIFTVAGAMIGEEQNIAALEGINKIELRPASIGMSSGAYIVEIRIGDSREYKKMLYLK